MHEQQRGIPHNTCERAQGSFGMQRLILSQAIEDVCSSPGTLICAMADPELPEGPGSPNRSRPMPNHGFSIERINMTYRAILQVCMTPAKQPTAV